MKLRTIEDVIEYLLYSRNGTEDIFVGIKGDIDISDEMTSSLKKKVMNIIIGREHGGIEWNMKFGMEIEKNR